MYCQVCEREIAKHEKTFEVEHHASPPKGKPYRIRGETILSCERCFHKGEYSRLACVVILEALEDYFNPKGYPEYRILKQRDAAHFLASENLDFWCQHLKGIEPDRLRQNLKTYGRGIYIKMKKEFTHGQS